MSEPQLDDSQWELSKENIQPIKQGRKASVLTNALNEAQQKKLNDERHKFEEELRALKGDDPLDVWYRYIIWVEQNYPKGGLKGNLIKLIESCFSTLCTNQKFEDKYNKDERFLDLWIKYANLSSSPVEVYQTLYKKDIFTELANFYQIWTWELEKLGNYKKANAIYLEGIQRKAKPLDNLEIAYTKFQARFAQMTLEGMNSTEDENAEAEIQRRAFSSLKAKGPNAKAPIERVATVIGSAGRLSSSAPKTNTLGPSFKIFQDENTPNVFVEPNLVSASTTPAARFTSHSTSSKENVKNPSAWSKNKVKQTTTQNIHVEDVNQLKQPTFQVHTDTSANDSCVTPASKRTEFGNVLSARKNAQEDDWTVPLFVSEPFNPNAQPQYCKHLVYCGNEEFSFEEIRSLAKKEEDNKFKEEQKRISAKDEEIKELRDMLKRQEGMIATLLHKQNISENSAEKSQTPEIHVRSKSVTPTILVTSSENISGPLRKSRSSSSKNLYEDSWVAINKSVSFAANVTHNVSHIHDESSTKALLTLKPVSILKDSSLTALQAGNVSKSPPSNNTTVSKDYLRSPTVNTKFAKNIVCGFFNETLSTTTNCEKSVNSLDIPQNNEITAPFQIFQDNASNNTDNLPESKDDILAPLPFYSDENESKADILAPFPIYSDENELPEFPVEDKVEVSPPFSIYCDENEPPKIPEVVQNKFTIYCDDEPVVPHTHKPNVTTNDENQENLPPSDYQVKKEKRPFSGILKPSAHVPFIPLEEQKKAEEEEEEEEFEGIEPLPESETAGNEYTMKMPLNSEAFARTGFVASTPAPWSFGVVPQVHQDDDFTMAVPISYQRKSILPDVSLHQDSDADRRSIEKSDSPSDEKNGENSGELMPPPNIVEPENNYFNSLTPMETTSGLTHITTKHLSPILEASREYRSSTSSSSGSCSVFSTNSNLCGGANNVSRSINFSQMKAVSIAEHEPYGAPSYNEYSKSGYVADKSRGESIISNISRKCTKSEVIEEEENDFDTSFDPNKIAAMLLGTSSTNPSGKVIEDEYSVKKDDKHSINERNRISSCNKENDIPGIKSSSGEISRTFSPLSRKVEYPLDIDPFDVALQESLLMNLKVSVDERGGFCAIKGKMPQIKPRSKISLSKEMYNVKRMIGSGAYAQVFHSSTIDPMNVTIAFNDDYDDDDENENDESQMIMKVQKPSCAWEFYICHELRERLKSLKATETILNSFMRINRGYFFGQGSILVSQYHKTGTLLDIINKYKTTGKNISENLVIYLMHKIITVLITLHSCDIIHGDLKPDNVLIVLPDSKEQENEKSVGIKLIDFGRSIDMSLYPPGMTFTRKVSTEGFTCCEMQDNRPWTFQTDLYGLASIAHCMLWGSYMNVKKEGSTWKISGVNYYRYMEKKFWENFFDKLLNIESCEALPDLKKVLKEFEQQLEFIDSLKTDLKRFVHLVEQR